MIALCPSRSSAVSSAIHDIDAAVRRVLLLKERLGLFDDPYRRGSQSKDASALANRRRLARDVGARSLVLLKNNRGALPLSKSFQRIALIGPFADSPGKCGALGARRRDPKVPLLSLPDCAALLPDIEIVYSPGVGIEDDNRCRDQDCGRSGSLTPMRSCFALARHPR